MRLYMHHFMALVPPLPPHTHTHTALTLSNWLLDLDEGSLTLSASGVPGTDHSGLNCRAFTLVNEM